MCPLQPTTNNLLHVQTSSTVPTSQFTHNNTPPMSPLQTAILTNNIANVKSLLTSGADPNTRFTDDDTPLILATRQNHFPIVRLLLTHDADVNAHNSSNHTALHEAVENNFQTTRLLLDNGANINALTFENYSPLHFAAREGNIGMSQFLIDRGADVNSQSCMYVDRSDGTELHHMGPTILHDVAQAGYKDMVQLLLKHGADPTIPDFNGKTALDFAKNIEIKQVLLDHVNK